MRRSIFLVLFSFFLFSCTSEDVKIDTKQSQLHYKLALELAQMNLFKNALEEFDLAIKFNPKDANIYRKKGVVLFRINRFKEAKNSFQKSIQLNPKDVQANINLGMVHYAAGNKNEALKSAYLKSMFWYQDKLEQTYNEAVEKGLLQDNSLSDYLC